MNEFGGFKHLFDKGFKDLYGKPTRHHKAKHKTRHHTLVRVRAHHRKVVRHHYPKQTGVRKSLHLDRKHKAKAVGWRKNRSDIRGKRI